MIRGESAGGIEQRRLFRRVCKADACPAPANQFRGFGTGRGVYVDEPDGRAVLPSRTAIARPRPRPRR
jgi:hypothetical protein